MNELNTGQFRSEYDEDLSLENEGKPKPEDHIPDLPENKKARGSSLIKHFHHKTPLIPRSPLEFLKSAPQHGLHMPVGVQVKVMQCWRCKAFGHRSGDADCPLNFSGNIILDTQRQAREVPTMTYNS